MNNDTTNQQTGQSPTPNIPTPNPLPQPNYPAPHQKTPKPPAGPDPDFVAIKGDGFSHILNHLLKKPLGIIYEITHNSDDSPQKIIPTLLIITLVSLGIFGIVLGMFSSGSQLWAAPLKVIGGVFFSGLICLPSLYIFGALGGMDAKVSHITGLMLTFLSITSLLLVGFAPVIWLFSTSSDSLVFFGFLSLCIWILCLLFGLRILNRASKSMGGGKGLHLQVWAIIFLLVTLQMTTTLRPIIGKPEKSEPLINLEEKRFFLGYWFESMAHENQQDYQSSTDSRIDSQEDPQKSNLEKRATRRDRQPATDSDPKTD